MQIHPKTSGSALGGALGILIVSVLGSIHSIHLTPAADAAIPTFLSTLGAWLVPAPDATPLSGWTRETGVPVPPKPSVSLPDPPAPPPA